MRMSVVLPHPDGPSRAVSSPVGNCSDATSSALKVAHCDDVACDAATVSTVDGSGIEGEYSSITTAADGLGVISYRDGTGANQDLKVAHCANVGCTSSSYVTVDTPGDVGWNTSVTIGSDGLPFVSYRDVAPIWTVATQLVFYGTPILYVIETVPHSLQKLIMANPLAAIIEQVRKWLIDPGAPGVAEAMGGGAWWLLPVGVLLAVCGLGLWIFNREAPRIAERL